MSQDNDPKPRHYVDEQELQPYAMQSLMPTAPPPDDEGSTAYDTIPGGSMPPNTSVQNGTSAKSGKTTISSGDPQRNPTAATTSDVYSMVNKPKAGPKKPQNVSDVYSVVKKPKKHNKNTNSPSKLETDGNMKVPTFEAKPNSISAGDGYSEVNAVPRLYPALNENTATTGTTPTVTTAGVDNPTSDTGVMARDPENRANNKVDIEMMENTVYDMDSTTDTDPPLNLTASAETRGGNKTDIEMMENTLYN